MSNPPCMVISSTSNYMYSLKSKEYNTRNTTFGERSASFASRLKHTTPIESSGVSEEYKKEEEVNNARSSFFSQIHTRRLKRQNTTIDKLVQNTQ